MPDVASLPPRSALPPDVEIPALPFVGITWYDRGKSYWMRRARTALVGALILFALGLIVAGFLSAARSSSSTDFAVLLVIEVAVLAASMAFIGVRTARRWNTPSLPGPLFPPNTAVQLAILVAGLVSFVFPGFYVALFLATLLPEPLTERQARLWMAGHLRERGIIAADSAPGIRTAE